jgi:NH3-dependent NAD+ synthetase
LRRSDGKWYLTRVKRAIYNFKMIADGDRVAVGVSGGKDSAALLYILKQFQRHSPVKFELMPAYVHLGWPIDPVSRRENLPLLKNPCPVSGSTKRNEMDKLIDELSTRYPDLREKWRAALLTSHYWKV